VIDVRSNRTRLVLVGGGVMALAAAGLLSGPSDATVAASAGKLPAKGIWAYDHGPTLPATGSFAIFQANLNVNAGKSNIYSFAVTVTGGTCKKNGQTDTGELVGGSAAKTLIPVKPNGSFSATRNAVGDETGSKGTVQFKGTFAGIHATGTITVHMHYPVLGACAATGKFRSNGVRIA
jgi:hypothetical protein